MEYLAEQLEAAYKILEICRGSQLYDEYGNRDIDLPEDVEIIRDGDPYDDEEYIIQKGARIARVTVTDKLNINLGLFGTLNLLQNAIERN